MRVAPKPRLRAPADLRAYAENAATWLLAGMTGAGIHGLWAMGYPLPAVVLAVVAWGGMFFVHHVEGVLAWRPLPLLLCSWPFCAAGALVMRELPREVWTLGMCTTVTVYVSLLWLHRGAQRIDRMVDRHAASAQVTP